MHSAVTLDFISGTPMNSASSSSSRAATNRRPVRERTSRASANVVTASTASTR